MKSEDDPVSDDEFVLRLVWHDFYRPGDPLTVKPRAFHPRADETTGISVFRRDCVAVPEDILLALPDPAKRTRYLIAALAVTALKALGLTVTPDRIAAVKGHAVLSELNCRAWSNDKATWQPKVEQLALLAGQSVVHQPLAAGGNG